VPNLRLNTITLAIAGLLSASLQAQDNTIANNETDVEVLSVVGKRVSYANNSTDNNMKYQQAPISNVLDLVNNLPGVNVGQGDAFGSDDYTTTISLRGFVIDRADQQLGITVDGVPNGGSGYAGGSKANRYMDSENTRYVEVGQGASDIASASLDALGGTLNFVSANPEMQRGARVGVSNGSHNARRYFARYDSGEILGNTTAYFSVSDSYNSRWIGSGSNGYSDRIHLEAKSITELDSGRITARVSYDDTHEDNYQPISLAHFAKTPRWDGLTNAWTGDPDIDQNFAETWSTLRENTLVYVKGEFDLSDSIALEITPYLHLQNGRGDWMPNYQVYTTDASGNRITKGTGANMQRYRYIDVNGLPILDPNSDTTDATRVASYRHTHYEKQRFGTTANLQWDLEMHQLRMGIWLEQQKRNQTRDWHNIIDPKIYHYFDKTPYWVQFDDDYTNKVFKYYLQDNITFGNLQLTLGVQQYLVDVSRTDDLNGKGKDSVDSDSSLLPSAGVVYSLNDHIEIFSGYAKNFKAISDGPLENKKSAELSSLKPETATNLDLGIRYSSDVVSMSTSLYRVKFNNRIVQLRYQTTADGTPNYLAEGDGDFDNVGGVTATGFEANINWRLNPNLSITSAITVNNAEYSEDVAASKEGADGEQLLVKDYRKGDKLAGIPEKMLTLSLDYNDDGYRAGISGKYVADYYGAAKHSFTANGGEAWNKDTISAHTIFNAYLGYEKDLGAASPFKSVDLALVMNNLTDKSYITGGSEGAYLIGAGRTASFTVSLGF